MDYFSCLKTCHLKLQINQRLKIMKRKIFPINLSYLGSSVHQYSTTTPSPQGLNENLLYFGR